MKFKFEINQTITVDGAQALVADRVITEGQPDYLLRPIDYPQVDFCKCGAKDCGGVSWFLESEIKN